MPRPRSAMRKIRDILRLALGEGLSRRQVAAATGVPRSTVGDHLARARLAGLAWPLPEGVDDAWLEGRLFSPPVPPLPSALRPVPDWPVVHRELRRRIVNELGEPLSPDRPPRARHRPHRSPSRSSRSPCSPMASPRYVVMTSSSVLSSAAPRYCAPASERRYLDKLVSRLGFEPRTQGLKVPCSDR